MFLASHCGAILCLWRCRIFRTTREMISLLSFLVSISNEYNLFLLLRVCIFRNTIFSHGFCHFAFLLNNFIKYYQRPPGSNTCVYKRESKKLVSAVQKSLIFEKVNLPFGYRIRLVPDSTIYECNVARSRLVMNFLGSKLWSPLRPL